MQIHIKNRFKYLRLYQNIFNVSWISQDWKNVIFDRSRKHWKFYTTMRTIFKLKWSKSTPIQSFNSIFMIIYLPNLYLLLILIRTLSHIFQIIFSSQKIQKIERCLKNLLDDVISSEIRYQFGFFNSFEKRLLRLMHRTWYAGYLTRLKRDRQKHTHVHKPSVQPKSGSLARNCGLRIISAVNSLTFGLRAYRVWYYGSFSRPLPGARGRRIPEGLKGAITPSFVVREKGEHKGERRDGEAG